LDDAGGGPEAELEAAPVLAVVVAALLPNK
jgi:hypothetical protein